MPIITVSRGTFSGGKELAECVADRIGAPCLSREILIETAATFGISDEILSEAIAKPPSMFQRFSRQRDAYVAFVRATLLQHAAAGSFVYHGYAGHLLLADIANVVRVRIIAPMTFRVPAAMKRLGISEKRAKAHIAKVDRERAKWTEFLYHMRWQDPALYDLVLNLERVSLADACEIVTAAARLKRFEWTEDSRREVADKALASLVSAALAKDERTQGSDLRVTASGGVVTLAGTTGLSQVRDAAPLIARAVPGVSAVRSEISLRSEIIPD
jgi:cytidylate kinase